LLHDTDGDEVILSDVTTDLETSGDALNEEVGKPRKRVKPIPTLADLAHACKTDEDRELLAASYLELSKAIWELVELKRSNGGVLPRGTLPQAAHRLCKSEDQISRLIARMEEHDRKRQAGNGVEPRVEAVIHGKPGRQKGKRDYPDDVKQFVIDAWRNLNWESLNHLHRTDRVRRRMRKSMIHKLVKQKYPHLNISAVTVRRIIDDFIENKPAHAAYGRGKEGDLKNNVTSIDADFGHVNNVWILDIRPMPIKSNYKGIDCTTGFLGVMEASSSKILQHKVLPRKDKDDAENVFGVDFTCQHVREQIALAILKVGRRPRWLYVDHGAQFGRALEVFLDLLTAEGEQPTQILPTPTGTPPGRGLIERFLGLIDEFNEWKPGFFDEDDWRKSLRNAKKYKFYEFEFLEAEFDTFIPRRNAKQRQTKAKKPKPSPNECYALGPDQGLTPPSLLHLGLFSGSAKRIDDRVPSRAGIRYDNKHFVLWDESPEIGAKLAGLALNKQARPTFVVTFDNLVVLYVKLDDQDWVLFVEKNKRKWSAQKQRAWKDSIDAYLTDEQRQSEARMQMALVDDIGRRLVVDPYEKDVVWYQEPPKVGRVVVRDGAGEDTASARLTARLSATQKRKKLSGKRSAQPGDSLSRQSSRTAHTSDRTGSSPNPSKAYGHSSLRNLRVDENDDDDDDGTNFMIQRMQKLTSPDGGESE
jgi:hypothetical protein